MSRTRLFALVSAAGTTVAAAVVVSATHGLLDAVMMVAVVLALAGLYRLRHFARATSLYRRHPELTTVADK
jgi:4-amino-4-deoxy-L-arabinose transferase-like glycosyltransferase